MQLHGLPIFKRILFPTAVFCLLWTSSCGILSRSASPSDIADQFYSLQISDPESPLPSELFLDEPTARTINVLLARRTASYGPCVSFRKVGSNRNITFDGGSRRETTTYMFEVECTDGHTRETLTVCRTRRTDPFRITAYIIEEIPPTDIPMPAGTSST